MLLNAEMLMDNMPEDFFDSFEQALTHAPPQDAHSVSNKVIDLYTDLIVGIYEGKFPRNKDIERAEQNCKRMLGIVMDVMVPASDVLTMRGNKKRFGKKKFRVAYHLWMWKEGDEVITEVDTITSEYEYRRHKAMQEKTGFAMSGGAKSHEHAKEMLLRRRDKLMNNIGGPIEAQSPIRMTYDDMDNAYDALYKIKMQSEKDYMKVLSGIGREIMMAEVVGEIGTSSYKKNAPVNMREIMDANTHNARLVIETMFTRINTRYLHMSASYAREPDRPFSPVYHCDMWLFLSDEGTFESLSVHYRDIKRSAWFDKNSYRRPSKLERISTAEYNKKFVEIMNQALDTDNIKLSPVDITRAILRKIRVRIRFIIGVIKGETGMVGW